jgi:hypothetical protein
MSALSQVPPRRPGNRPPRHIAWSDASCWNNGLPDATKVAVFNSANSGSCVFDSTVLAANRTVAGLQINSGYNGSLTLSSGNTLTISSLSNDNTTGFKMLSSTASISQQSADDIILITGGGDGTYNKWSGGSIAGPAQSKIYINGSSTFLITQVAGSGGSLGDNIVVGQDNMGTCTLAFNGQTATLSVTNNAGILISDATNDGATAPNQVLFDGDTTGVGTVAQGLSTSCSDSFIDNFGKIIRSNAGTFDTGLPIKNETSGSGWTAKVDLQSDLKVSGWSGSKTAGNSVDEEGGEVILENGKTLTVSHGFIMNAGQLETYGQAKCTIDNGQR